MSRSVLFCISHSHFGGAQELWANLVEGFRALGREAGLLALYPVEGSLAATPPGIDWNYAALERPRGPAGSISLLRTLARKLRAERPAVVFTALPAANVLVPLAVTLGRVNAKVITTHHGPAETYNRKLDALDALTGRFQCVSKIVCVSDAVASSHHRKSAKYRSKLLTIRNAVPPDIEKLLSELRALHAPRNAQTRLVTSSGRLEAQKNYPMLIRAMQCLPDVKLEIVGAGPDEAMLRQLADAVGVTDRVTFAGQKTREEALRTVAGAAIFTQVSLYEGNSLSLIEAAKLGLPLIVSDVPEQREAITDTAGRLCGVAIPIDDHLRLAAAILNVLNNPADYAELAERSAELGNDIRFSVLLDSYAALAT